jgi:hypothetical protein
LGHRSRTGRRRVIFQYDHKAYRLAQSIVRLDLDSPGEFVCLINAIPMPLESWPPVERVVRLLADPLLGLAEARGSPEAKLRLGDRLDTVVGRVNRLAGEAEGR